MRGLLIFLSVVGALMAITAASAQADGTSGYAYERGGEIIWSYEQLAPGGYGAPVQVPCPAAYPTITGGGYLNQAWGFEVSQSRPYPANGQWGWRVQEHNPTNQNGYGFYDFAVCI